MPTPSAPASKLFRPVYCSCQNRTIRHGRSKDGSEDVYICPVCGSVKHLGVGQLCKTPASPLAPIR